MSQRKIGVYVCHCGGNISDYVDVDKVIEAVQSDPGVVVARTAMFTCSDATQQEIVQDIREKELDGIVVASCSPKLHTFTFREMSKRAGLNPYEYTQVNLREQCSWAHTDDKAGATDKGIRLVRAGINRTRLTTPLEPIVVETTPKAVVVGGGITGLRSALGLAEIGLAVFLVEKEPELGGWVATFGDMYPKGRNGRELISGLVQKVLSHPSITVFKNAEVVSKTGSFGNYRVGIEVQTGGSAPDAARELIEVDAGSIVVATGFQNYIPADDEFGYGLEGVVTLPEFKAMVDASTGPLVYHGKPVESIAYVYCVGSRQPEGNQYCSRYCCTAAIHASLEVADLSVRGHGGTSEGCVAAGAYAGTGSAAGSGQARQYHLYRDIRSYGKYETLYNESRDKGSIYLRFPDDEPPTVEKDPAGKGLRVTVRDVLTGGQELTIPADLVVLATGMVPRENEDLVKTLKLPLGNDGFFNEIHPKLRPVETVVDGVFICGACQSPKNSSEAVAAGLAAVTQSAALLKRGFAELDPLIATVDTDLCTWCSKCLEACPYLAPKETEVDGRTVAVIDKAACKGCGGCVPVCPYNAIDLQGYTDAQIRAMIDGLFQEVAAC
jgi:heterodisulfide reductase subunit A2